MIGYRIQQANHPVALLLDPATQLSTSWADDTDVREGVSVCMSVEDLAGYFAQSGVALDDDCLLVAVECVWADDEDADAHLGAELVFPTAMVSAEPVPASFFDLVADAHERLAA